MWIKSDERDVLINTQLISELFAQESEKYDTCCILAHLAGVPKAVIIANYEQKRTAQSALDTIFEAIQNGEDTFVLPEDGDIRLAYSDGTIHGGGVSTFRRVRK